jgi:hypothetical protein
MGRSGRRSFACPQQHVRHSRRWCRQKWLDRRRKSACIIIVGPNSLIAKSSLPLLHRPRFRPDSTLKALTAATVTLATIPSTVTHSLPRTLITIKVNANADDTFHFYFTILLNLIFKRSSFGSCYPISPIRDSIPRQSLCFNYVFDFFSNHLTRANIFILTKYPLCFLIKCQGIFNATNPFKHFITIGDVLLKCHLIFPSFTFLSRINFNK